MGVVEYGLVNPCTVMAAVLRVVTPAVTDNVIVTWFVCMLQPVIDNEPVVYREINFKNS